jgi:hypothetical protein
MRIAPGRNRIYLIYHKDALPKRLSGRHSVDEMVGQLQAVGAELGRPALLQASTDHIAGSKSLIEMVWF